VHGIAGPIHSAHLSERRDATGAARDVAAKCRVSASVWVTVIDESAFTGVSLVVCVMGFGAKARR